VSVRDTLFPALGDWPAAIERVADAREDADAIRLVAGATGLERLAGLPRLRRLWCFNVSHSGLEAIAAARSLERLYVETLATSDLALLGRLPRLSVLSIDSCTGAESLQDLSSLTSLTALSLVNFKRVRSLEPLRSLTGLRGLVVSGSMWTRMRVESLAPIGDLHALEHLDLTNLKVADDSLAPLAGLERLESLDCANFYPWAEFARLAGALPRTRCSWFDPFQPIDFESCRKCDRRTRVMPSGRGLARLCRTCDRGKLQRHVERFDAVRRAEARSRSDRAR
jgi:hypothetical protein